MIDSSILNHLRCGICAIGYLTVKAEEYVKDAKSPFFKVIGTGFLVRDTTVMTNRHVIQGLTDAQKDIGFPDDQRVLQFVYPVKVDVWATAFCSFGWVGFSLSEDLDVGFIDFKRRPESEFQQCQPLVLGELSSIAAGQPVAVCGYPYGTAMLQRGGKGKIYRFGPVLQQGYVSAIAPYDTSSSRVEELLLDIRVAGGMSGSPVFCPGDGTVVGMVYGTWEATTAVAVPVDSKRVSQWLAMHDKGHSAGAGSLVRGSVDHSVPRSNAGN